MPPALLEGPEELGGQEAEEAGNAKADNHDEQHDHRDDEPCWVCEGGFFFGGG